MRGAPVLLTQYVRRGDEWIVRSVRDRGTVLHSHALDIAIPMEAIYALVETEDMTETSAGDDA